MLDTTQGRAPFPQLRKNLKRSASTASLPTPPRTHRRHARGRSRGSCDSESDGDKVLLSTDDELEHVGKDERGGPSKKRRVGDTTQVIADAEEDAFWLGGSSEAAVAAASASKADAVAKVQSQQQQPRQQDPLLYRKRKATTIDDSVAVAPVSPPPSHRKTTNKSPTPNASPMSIDSPIRSAKFSSPPSTPKTRSATRRAALLRDSPENPFLATPFADSDPGSPMASSNPSPSTPSKGSASYDKPFINYVFRGTRRTYQNPYYNHAEDRPLSPPPASKLPIDHPDYSPSMMCAPKVLFPTARGKQAKGKGKEALSAITPKGQRKAQQSLSSEEDRDEDLDNLKPTKLNFGRAAVHKSKPVAGRVTRSKSPGKTAG